MQFAELFGQPNVYPRAGFTPEDRPGENPFALPVVQEVAPSDIPFGASGWHTDTPYVPTPPFATLLYAVEVPGAGLGDTLFGDGVAAFRSLSAGLQAQLRGLRLLQSSVLRHQKGVKTLKQTGHLAASAKTPLEAIHPAVRRHPETGEEALYCELQYKCQRFWNFISLMQR